MDKTTVFELIAGSWASVTILLVLGFLNAMRQDIIKIEKRLTLLDGRIYDLIIKQGGGEYGIKRGVEDGGQVRGGPRSG